MEGSRLNQVPKIISSEISDGYPSIPSQHEEWVTLHERHGTRLQSAWGGVLSRFGIEGVIIHSGRAHQRNSQDDQYWPVSPTPYFTHWLAYQETPALLLVRGGERPKLICETHTSYWEGPGPRNEHWCRSFFDIETVSSLEKVQDCNGFVFLGDDVQLASKLGIPPEQRNRADLLEILNQFRTLKSDYEVASIRAANKIAWRGHQVLKQVFLSTNVSEFQLHLKYLEETAQTDFDVPYGNIVAQGEHCGILHHIHYDRRVRSGDLSLLVDAGAQVNGYASDITRTWVRGESKSASLFQTLIDGVAKIQTHAIQNVQVGRSYEDLHNEVHHKIAIMISDIGLVSGNPEDLVSHGVTRKFFPHGLGHSLGIQVHDVGMRRKTPAAENPYLRNTSTIEAGQVMTIEPGIYFIPALLEELKAGPFGAQVNQNLLSELTPFGGIRIEDNILATVKGPVNLTQ